MKLSIFLALFFLASQVCFSQAQNSTIMDIITENADLSELNNLTRMNDSIVALFNETDNLTVFAPVNSAFADNSTSGSIVLLYHVLNTAILLDELVDGELLKTYFFDPQLPEDTEQLIKVSKLADGTVQINGVTVNGTYLNATNGVIYLIDSVLDTPAGIPTLASADFQILFSLAGRANIADILQSPGITVLAPSDAVFQQLSPLLLSYLNANESSFANTTKPTDDIKSILETHILNGLVYAYDLYTANYTVDNMTAQNISVPTWNNETLYFNVNSSGPIYITDPTGAVSSITLADILAANGVIHEISHVLLPSTFYFDVTKVLIGLGLSELYQALASNETNLLASLEPPNVVTVFAPSDAALVAFLQANPNITPQQLTDTLLYHVINGTVLSSELQNGLIDTLYSPSTLPGSQKLKVSISGANVKINDATVTSPNNNGSNGVVHIIDKVLALPLNIAAVAQSSQFNVLLNVLPPSLATYLSTSSDLTLFAPTDAAFGTLPLGYFGYLTSSDTTASAQLLNILLYHIIPQNTLYSSQITSDRTLPTNLTNSPLNVFVRGAPGPLSIYFQSLLVQNETINVVSVDDLASNGVVHGIDGVLLPPTFVINLSSTISGIANASIFYSLLSHNFSFIDVLNTSNNYTILIPVNSAFDEHNISAWDTTQINNTVSYHIIIGSFDITGHNITAYQTLNPNVSIVRKAEGFALKQSGVEDTGDEADLLPGSSYGYPNGRIYFVDKVFITSEPEKKLSIGAVIIISVVGGVILLLIIAFIIYKVRSSKSGYEEV